MAVKNFIAELRWRGMLNDSTPEVEEHLLKGPASGYIGFDPTADSLHVGNLVQIMTLMHFQRCGHKPVALVGGATGMVGDPSGKKSERNLLDEEALRHNQECVRRQLERFLDFTGTENPARMVNNYDWFKEMGFLRFIREVGKHITVNYMLAKDSVKTRLDSGLSFTEFSYQLVQGYDYYWLNKHEGCTVQMGGSDQWGNITTGTELIRRMGGSEAFAVTTPLITKADGSKFGKSEGGNIWLDAARTSPYKFYQFWLNSSDADVERYVRIFTTWEQERVEALIAEHAKAPHLRVLQKELAADITRRVHGESETSKVVEDSNRIFEGLRTGSFAEWPEETWMQASGSLPSYELDGPISENMRLTEFMSGATGNIIYLSKGEARRGIQEGAVRLNGNKIVEDREIMQSEFILDRFVVIAKGKKQPFIIYVRKK